MLTVIGPDRPGLVGALSDVIVRHQGNWLESRMAHMAGQFAGIVHVQVPASELAPLTQALTALSERGLLVSVVHSQALAPEPGAALEVSLVGRDRPGIVQQIAAKLAEAGVNVEELETQCTPGPMSGEPLFRAQVQLRLPPGKSSAGLLRELESVADDLMVDLAWNEPGDAEDSG